MNLTKYDPYYANVIAEIKNNLGWSQYYYGVFEKVIKDNNFKNVAEVGIGYGMHSKSILDNTNIEKLFLIDPMQYYANDAFADFIVSKGGFDKLVGNIKLHLSDHNARYTWFRQPSTTITNEQIPDGSLDAVFVDGDHSYDAVKQDLPFWFKKLRIGGWLLGDDYASCHPGTTRAVDEFAKKQNLVTEFLYKPNTKYPIYKFIKN